MLFNLCFLKFTQGDIWSSCPFFLNVQCHCTFLWQFIYPGLHWWIFKLFAVFYCYRVARGILVYPSFGECVRVCWQCRSRSRTVGLRIYSPLNLLWPTHYSEWLYQFTLHRPFIWVPVWAHLCQHLTLSVF